MSSQVWRWSAGEIAQAIRTQPISSREAVNSRLGRFAEPNTVVGGSNPRAPTNRKRQVILIDQAGACRFFYWRHGLRHGYSCALAAIEDIACPVSFCPEAAHIGRAVYSFNSGERARGGKTKTTSSRRDCSTNRDGVPRCASVPADTRSEISLIA